jgi:MFS family permease
MSRCKDIKTYVAARIIYSIGSSGFVYVLSVMIADMSSLRNRALAFAFIELPYVATALLAQK